jgi:anti-sigma regulatory factor (Ser/Thr protein kinase)
VTGIAETRRFDVTVEAVSALDEWVKNVGLKWGKSERTVFATRLCIAELAGNVVEHGTSMSASDHIIVTLRCRRDGIGVEFLDSRGAFDPTSDDFCTSPSSSKSMAAGGRGLMLVHAYAKNVSYFNDGTYNHVELEIAL